MGKRIFVVAGLGVFFVAALHPAAAGVLCKRKTGALFVRDTACKPKETSVTAAEVGAVGPQGIPGDPGAAGDPGPGARWAAVAADGTILAQSGGISLSSHPFDGEYILEFGESMATRALFVVPAAHDNALSGAGWVGPCGTGPLGYTNCSSQPDTRVHVFMHDPTNTGSADHGFYIMALP